MDNKTDEIDQLTQTIAELEITTNRLKQRQESLIKRRTSTRVKKRSAKAGQYQYKVGNIVEVKDNYKGRRGIRGRVAELHGAQLRLEPLDGLA